MVEATIEKLEFHRLAHNYNAGGNLHAFRSTPFDPSEPEEWLGSTTCRFGKTIDGLTTLPSGGYLRDRIERDPEQWLGKSHMKALGNNPAILVKLLDAGQRLPVHAHPGRPFSRRLLGSQYGKTEAWIILEAAPGAHLYLGFREAVDPTDLRRMVEQQDTGRMLGMLNEIPVVRGDVVVVPAGLTHAFTSGIFLAEVEEPTDFSILLEFEGFVESSGVASLNLGWDQVLEAVDHRRSSAIQLSALLTHIDLDSTDSTRTPLFGRDISSRFFRGQHVVAADTAELERGYAIAIVLRGKGELVPELGLPVPALKGDAFVVPYSAGMVRISGAMSALWFQPALERPPDEYAMASVLPQFQS
jgi:mannose-6-phosphate isomerase